MGIWDAWPHRGWDDQTGMKRNQEGPLPDGWTKEFLNRADLERSFRDLETSHHFHASTMRGRIRTLQLRTSEAWEHFDQAEILYRNTEESIDNSTRAFLLQVYRFENALLEGPEAGEPEIAEPVLRDFPAAILDEFPDLRRALNLRKRVQGTYLLYGGHSLEALRVFRELTEDRRVGNEALAHSYLSLACCYFNLGDEDEGQRFLDSSELAIHACDTVLNRGYFCGLLYALYVFKDDSRKASEWKEFLYSLPCPDATKGALLGRGERFVTRCRQQNHLLVF